MKSMRVVAWILVLVLIAAGMSQTSHYIEVKEVQHNIAEKILRFHVRANSDSKRDQALKIKVRDAIGSLMGPKLTNVSDRKECTRIIESHMAEIVNIAETTVRDGGYDYPIEAYIADVKFPDKTYGAYTFPAGTYQALEVIIGSGTGHNWWCVMYPNMCFSGSVYEVVEEKAEKSLKSSLDTREYKSLMEKKDYKVQCKILKFVNPYLDKLQEDKTNQEQGT